MKPKPWKSVPTELMEDILLECRVEAHKSVWSIAKNCGSKEVRDGRHYGDR